MMALLARLLTAPLSRAILSVLKSMQTRKLSEAALRAEAEKAAAQAIASLSGKRLSAARDIILAELHGSSALQRDWRALVALTSYASYWYVVVAIPHLVSWGLMSPPHFGEKGLENLFWLTILGIGGYMGGQALEKAAIVRRAGRI